MPITQLGPAGYGVRRYGSFEGKEPSAVSTLPAVATRGRPFLRTVGRMMGAWAGVCMAFGLVLAVAFA